MTSKLERSGHTLKAKPCKVVHRAILTPIAASFLHRPRCSCNPDASGVDCIITGSPNHNFFEIPYVLADISFGFAKKNRIANDLPRTMPGDITAAPCFDQINATSAKLLRGNRRLSSEASRGLPSDAEEGRASGRYRCAPRDAALLECEHRAIGD